MNISLLFVISYFQNMPVPSQIGKVAVYVQTGNYMGSGTVG